MKSLLNPRWLILINTLPIILIIFIGWGEYSIIKSLLSEENKSLWRDLAIALVGMSVLTLSYSIVASLKKKSINIIYCIITLIAYIAYLLVFFENDDLIPWSIPNWMVSGNIHLYMASAIMPTLAHACLCLVVILTPMAEKRRGWTNFVAALLVPLLFYIFVVIIAPLWDSLGDDSDSFFIISIIAIAGVLLFLFFLVRGIYILITRKGITTELSLLWKIPITIVLPVAGLLANQFTFPNMFGDFSNPWFYILAIVNGALLCLPQSNNLKYRTALFVGRSIFFAFTFYFFIVFLPFLPLSLFAILLLGLGFLMLTPLVLFVIHVNTLYQDVKYLRNSFPSWAINLMCVIGFLIIPISITLIYKHDKKIIDETLDYLYSPDYTKEYKFNRNSIERIIESADSRTGRTFGLYSSTPYLASYYRWLVLDNLNLSSSRKDLIHTVFHGDHSGRFSSKSIPVKPPVQDEIQNKNTIAITDLNHSSLYDKEQDAWISWIDLSIYNPDKPIWNAEYITSLELPDGCWISDYYLDVEGVRKKGILAEKKAAIWIYQEIRNVNRDPGLLRYTAGNKIDFRVFPFQVDETRYTGIEFIHKEPFLLNVDNDSIPLGELRKAVTQKVENKNFSYISTYEKGLLKKTTRKPYYHFIVDITHYDKEIFIDQINKILKSNLISGNDAKISYTGSYVETKKLTEGWEEELRKKGDKGGFFLDRALRKAMFQHYVSPEEDKYPLFVAIYDAYASPTVWMKDFDDFNRQRLLLRI